MTRRKATITVDGDKLAEARRLARASSNSGTIDIALDTLIHQARLRHDVAAYAQRPPSDEDVGLDQLGADWRDLTDDTDWASLYDDHGG